MLNMPAPVVGTDAPDPLQGTDARPDEVEVEVVYAFAEHQELIQLTLPSGSTVQQALEASGLLQKYPEIDLAKSKLGIFGKVSKADTLLREHDRVEIYRPLIADPKEARKQRATEGKMQKNCGGKKA